MSLAVVSLSTALICFNAVCHPALVGRDTPKGVFPLVKRMVAAPGYGGDVLQFKETDREVFAVHRVWLLKPAQRRGERLANGTTEDRKNITGGCVNVTPAVYEVLQRATHLQIVD